MLRYINIKNLRSIKNANVEIAPLTVLYGPNGSGKSTLMHALAILRNVVLNPNQPVDSFFNLGFASFGGFQQVVFNHSLDEQIKLEIGYEHDLKQIAYGATLGKKSGRFELRIGEPWAISPMMEITFPYPVTQHQAFTLKTEENIFEISWNGILVETVQTINIIEQPEAARKAQELGTFLNSPLEMLRRTDFVHLKRGFSKPHYGSAPLPPTILTEDEVATLLANDPYLESEVSHHLEQILQRDLRVRATPGTSFFQLNTTDKTTGLATELVNDGFGVNQVVYLLTKTLRGDVSLVCIEEPEIHLHPKALRNLANELVRLIKEKQKTIIISTHSEHFVLALLGAVSKKLLNPDEISCYLCIKDRRESKFKRQRVSADGQIEGGLMSFMEGELEDLKDILGVSKRRG